MSDTDRWIIRTSDRLAFKKCRLQWDWGSKIRQDYEPNVTDWNLSFGTAVHAGQDAWYDPRTWHLDRPTRRGLAMAAFLGALPKLPQNPSEEAVSDYQADIALGKGMLDHYFEWAAEWDKHITPIHTEIEFEVPIQAPDVTLPNGFQNLDGQLYFGGWAVVYQGRIDLLLKDEYGFYWIVDWKTTGRIDGSHEWLQMDEQITSYCWALSIMLGIPIAGFLYVELLKELPKPPRVLKNGSLSIDKSQNTTYQLYLDALAEIGYTGPGPYDEILDHLRAQGNKFFRRTQVHRSQTELELMGDRISLEAVDMLNDPSIYPNPSKFNCGRCAFKAPCLARADGSDFGWMLSDSFHLRSAVAS